MRKFQREYIEKYPSINKVFTSLTGNRRRGSEATVENYVNGISRFIGYLGYDDPEVVLEAMRKGDIDAQKEVDKFIDYGLDELGIAHNTVKNYVFGIKSWLDLNEIMINWKAFKMPTGSFKTVHDRAPTKQELRKILRHTLSLRDQAIIYCDTSSGLRISTLLSLRVGDVNFDYPDVAKFTVVRKKGRKFSANSADFFVSFITPEAKQVLFEYLDQRKNMGEEITQNSPLFSDIYGRGQFIKTNNFEKVYKRTLIRAGLSMKSGKWYVLHVHTLRKYFRSNCIGVDESYREHWMGHKGKYLDESYFRAEEQRHLEEYRKTIPNLTIQEIKKDDSDLKKQIALTFLKMQGYGEDKIRRFEEILERAKDTDEALDEFRKLKDEASQTTITTTTQSPVHLRIMKKSKQKYMVAKGEQDLINKLEIGWNLVQTLGEDKYLLEL